MVRLDIMQTPHFCPNGTPSSAPCMPGAFGTPKLPLLNLTEHTLAWLASIQTCLAMQLAVRTGTSFPQSARVHHGLTGERTERSGGTPGCALMQPGRLSINALLTASVHLSIPLPAATAEDGLAEQQGGRTSTSLPCSQAGACSMRARGTAVVLPAPGGACSTRALLTSRALSTSGRTSWIGRPSPTELTAAAGAVARRHTCVDVCGCTLPAARSGCCGAGLAHLQDRNGLKKIHREKRSSY